ncbi:vesicular, overexpressed in cancer, prosurvival protein 1 isoform X1 [Takifugu rubripes]|uniref:vesicular, overexpressed in cancer, prosurvival protein 1 isoform X1 n=1 Tax=Takifugu rubripes TaxID=31033 RepID=UPI00114555E8|nr:vesicular, overexpressed in cancer, prosurvival protein 1 isoform X1 [Takifugu rubripes]XP_029687814.1 vesicular, overexpressed in cancer, prosurvival protein 1 isoform X1 [Takifugu rubripes]
MRNPAAQLVLASLLLLELNVVRRASLKLQMIPMVSNSDIMCVDAKKYCWYFDGGYPIYFICRSYEDCCRTRCCVRVLSIHRLWYFWVLLMAGVLFCCGAGFFIRRRISPSPLTDEPTFNVSFTRCQVTTPVSQQPGSLQELNGGPGGAPTAPGTQPGAAPKMMAFYPPPPSYCSPPPPSYCNHPPPSYEQVFQNNKKK